VVEATAGTGVASWIWVVMLLLLHVRSRR